MWDYDKWREVAKDLPRIDQWGADTCSKVLSAYWGKPITALALAEGCNPSSGYPYWIFWYKDASAAKE